MNDDFQDVRESARNSWLVRTAAIAGDTLNNAWGSSLVGARAATARGSFSSMTVAHRIRWVAMMITIAAIGHMALRSLLPATVAPALPSVFIGGVAAIAATIAWQAGAFEQAWRKR